MRRIGRLLVRHAEIQTKKGKLSTVDQGSRVLRGLSDRCTALVAIALIASCAQHARPRNSLTVPLRAALCCCRKRAERTTLANPCNSMKCCKNSKMAEVDKLAHGTTRAGAARAAHAASV